MRQCVEFETEEDFHSKIFVSIFCCEILACSNSARDWDNVFNIYPLLLFSVWGLFCCYGSSGSH